MKFWKRSELIIWILSRRRGVTGNCLDAEDGGLARPARVEQAALWGGPYPEYCLPGAMEKVEAEQEAEEEEEEEEEEESGPVKIRFKYLTFLND